MGTGTLKGKVIVIVGGTAGLGLAATHAVTAAGAKVVSVGLNEASREISTAAGQTITLVADATRRGTAERAVHEAVHTWGRLDGLYHVAGGSGRRMGDGPLHEATDAGWDNTLRLNLTSQFQSNRAAVRQFLSQGDGGVIVNMGSVLGWSPSPNHFATLAYAASKAAVIGMTRSAAAYYAPHRIRFNVIAPALVETPMSQRAAGDPEIIQFIQSKQPLDGGRISQPQDLDAAVVYLLSDEAKSVTGQVLAVDGAWCTSEGQLAVI